MGDKTVTINNLNNHYKFKKPVKVTLEYENGYVLSSMKELVLWGQGIDEDGAIDDLKLDILKFYESMVDYPDNRLGKAIKKEKYWMLENIVGV